MKATLTPRRSGAPASPRPSAPRNWVFGLLGAVVTLGLLTLVALGIGFLAYVAPGPGATRLGRAAGVTVVLRRGGGLTEIGAALEHAHVIGSSPLFLAAAQLTGAARRLKPGEYLFAPGTSLRDVIRRIRSGEVVRHHVTVPEGLTSRQVLDVLARVNVLVGAAPATPAEGSLLPETYDVLRGDTRAVVVSRMSDARDRLLAQLWTHRRQGLPYVGAEQAVTLASIVEKETAKASERPLVAGVYVNRLRRGMNLDADPTVVYGVNGGAPLGRGLTMTELQTPTPYNTYLNPGLPPTPIANPGRASLAAALDPATTDALYFVADGMGGHVFAATLEAQSRNVAQWRRLERERARSAPAMSAHEHR